ncbi:MAG: TetR family transcriptional regulator [Burkholderiales bacterium]|nr:TetR family transcriptional regulator [Burkholderiales bacterium]
MDDPSARILESATRHFADHGFEDASVRAIAGAAKVNPALINYYFRSKDDLYREVVVHSVQRLAEARLQTLDRLEADAKGAPIPVEVLIAATAGPIFAESQDPGADRRAYIRFLARLFTHPGPATIEVVFGGLTELRSRVFEALRRSLPHVPRRELAWRYLFLSGSVHFTAAQIGYVEVISGGECDSTDLDGALPLFIRAQAAMLSAPAASAGDRRLARKYQRPPDPTLSATAKASDAPPTSRRRRAN